MPSIFIFIFLFLLFFLLFGFHKSPHKICGKSSPGSLKTRKAFNLESKTSVIVAGSAAGALDVTGLGAQPASEKTRMAHSPASAAQKSVIIGKEGFFIQNSLPKWLSGPKTAPGGLSAGVAGRRPPRRACWLI